MILTILTGFIMYGLISLTIYLYGDYNTLIRKWKKMKIKKCFK